VFGGAGGGAGGMVGEELGVAGPEGSGRRVVLEKVGGSVRCEVQVARRGREVAELGRGK
jgi:hypothetical protein